MTRYVRVRTAEGPQMAVEADGGGVCFVLDLDGEPVRNLLDLITAEPETLVRDESSSTSVAGSVLLAPVTELPRNVLCVGKNYTEHSTEFSGSGYDTSGNVDDEAFILFTKPASAIVGPGDAIVLSPAVSAEVDYEGELAIVIGRGGRDVAPEETWNHVFGYTIVNDVTARDLQKKHRQWFLGKSLDTFCPMGPAVVTADEFDARTARIQTWVNDELRQDASTSMMIHDIPTILSTISRIVGLRPGDVVATGTPAGVGIGFSPPRFLNDGDVVTVQIDGIGRLVNRVVGPVTTSESSPEGALRWPVSISTAAP